MRILCDVDGVVCALHEKWLRAYRELTGEQFYPSDAKEWDFIPLLQQPDEMWEILDSPDFYDDVRVIRGALNGVNTLRNMGHHVVFVSSCTPNGARGKMLWLQRHGFIPEGIKPNSFNDFIAAGDKSFIMGDAMIDDGAHNLRNFKGTKLLFDAPYNQERGRYIRVHTWKEIVHFFRLLPKKRTKLYDPIEGE